MSKNLTIAVCVAMLAHLLIFSISITLPKTKSVRVKEITVTLLNEPNENQLEIDVFEAKPLQEVSQTPEPKAQSSLDVLASQEKQQKESIKVIETAVSNTALKVWLETETKVFAAQNPQSVREFYKTFSPQARYVSPPELSPYNSKSVPRGSTAFDTEIDGKVTCTVKIMNLLDISAEPSFTYKDCTPPKEFSLNLAKPNNGWMAR